MDEQTAYSDGFKAGKAEATEKILRELRLAYKTYKHHFEDIANAFGDVITIIERKQNES